MYVCTYVCMYVCIHVYMYTCVHVHVYVHVHIHTDRQTDRQICILQFGIPQTYLGLYVICTWYFVPDLGQRFGPRGFCLFEAGRGHLTTGMDKEPIDLTSDTLQLEAVCNRLLAFLSS